MWDFGINIYIYFFGWGLCRYGEIFKTHIHGCPCVMLATPEAARFVLVTQAHLFKPTFPHSKERLIGPSALFFHQSDAHLRLRKVVQSSLSPDPVRALAPGIDALASSALASWLPGRPINTFQEMKKVSEPVISHITKILNFEVHMIVTNEHSNSVHT